MSALCSKNFFTSIWKLLILLMYIYASRKRKADLCQIFKSFDCNSTISLKELNELTDDYWYFKEYISCKLIEEPRLVFELYPNFTFDPRYFNDILRRKDLMIGICFNEDLKKLVYIEIVNPSEYVDRFLEHLLHLKNLEHFSFSGLNLTEIPKMIYKFKNLKALNLESNGSDNFKIDWEQLPNLKYLSIGESEKLTKIDESFFNLSSLVVLRIGDCSIAEIPRDINKLRNLVTLCIYKTPIKSFPRNLSNLKKLQYLSIFNCTLEELVINMLDHPKLKYLYLHHNRSLKRLKIMISEIPLKLKFFDIGYCPLEDVEFWVNLKNTKFGMCYHKNQQLDHFDYVIKFNPSGLINFSKTKEMRKFKTFEYYINVGPDLNKTILIREIDLDKTKVISRNALVFKWNSICKKIQMENKPSLHDEYKRSIEFYE